MEKSSCQKRSSDKGWVVSCAMRAVVETAVTALVLSGISCSMLEKISSRSSPKIVLREERYDFGKRSQDVVVQHTFHVLNVGDDTLVITEVETGCGCIKAMVSSDRIAPGDSGRLLVTVNLSGQVGRMNTMMTAHSNDPESPEKHITIAVEIEKGVHHGTMRSPTNLGSIFSGECATCHRDNGTGKVERDLFDADCALCHGAPWFHVDATPETRSIGDSLVERGATSSRDKPAPSLTNKSLALLGVNTVRDIITNGRRGTMMPAFGEMNGGPLSDEQVESLVKYLARSSGMQYP